MFLMPFQESVFCATAPQSSTDGPGAISLHDIQTGSALASFKHTCAAPHCTAFVESRHGQGGFVLASQPEKSILNVYNFQKNQPVLKIVLPEKLTCIAVDRRGDFCAGGTAQGRIHLWEIASGILYNSWDAHYRRITVLKFTHDGVSLLSGSEDSGVGVWLVSRLLDDDLQDELPMSYCTLSDHTLPITDIACGIGSFPSCRVLTASVDHSVKLWDLSSRSLLTTFQFPLPISCLAWDPTERLFFAASADSLGSIHQVNLFRQHEDKFRGNQVIEAIGGSGVTDIIRVSEQDLPASKKRLITAGQPVTALCISLTSSLLLVGTSEGLINIYDVPSHQVIRTIRTHKGFSITHLATMLKPPDLIGHVSLTTNLGAGGTADQNDVMNLRPVVPFHRMRDVKAREKHEVTMVLPAQDMVYENEITSYSTPELLRDHAFFIQPPSSIPTPLDSASLQSKVTELEAEVGRLQEQLGKAKGINDAMWETVVQKVVGYQKEKPNRETGSGVEGADTTKADSEDNERRRKRSRS